jgi:peptidoglycan hydrolase CwlO-like protein
LDRKRFCSTQIPGITAGALILVCAAGLLAPAAAVRKDRIASVYEKQLRKKTDALDSIKIEINKRRKKIGELEKAEGNYLARLEYLETNIAASKQYLVMLSKRIDTAETTIVHLTDSLAQARSLLAGRQSVMKLRLRRAYMTGTLSPLMTLLMSRNPLDIIHRARYLEEVYNYDQNLALKIDRSRQAIDEKKRSLKKRLRAAPLSRTYAQRKNRTWP